MDSERGKASTTKYDWKDDGHGLVILGADGALLTTIAGHGYERDVITAALDKALGK